MSVNKNSKNVAKTVLTASILGIAVMAAAGHANAYGKSRIDAEQAREAAAIEQGRYSGELTRREYRELSAEQARIRAMERNALSDGHISKREYRDIREAQENAKRHISQETHDGQKSVWRKWLYNHRY